MGTNFWWPDRSLTFTPRPIDSAPPTRRVRLAVLPPRARGNSSLMRSVLMPARRLKGAQRGNQSGARSWVGRAPQLLSVSSQVAARPHNCHVCVSLTSPSPRLHPCRRHGRDALHVLLWRRRATLQIKNATVDRFGYSVWFLLSLLGVSSNKESSFACWDWVNISWVADKNTPRGGRCTPSTPYSPVGYWSTALRRSHLSLAASWKQQKKKTTKKAQTFNPVCFKVEKRTQCTLAF